MRKNLQSIGWQEWVELPQLKVPAVKVKIDTGAKTSSLHAFNIEKVRRNKRDYASFEVHPLQGNNLLLIHCTAPIIDVRGVMSSNGIVEQRLVIKTPLVLGTEKWDIELTLSNRDPLRFRMLLGREALKGKVFIDPSKTLVVRKYKERELLKLYKNSN